LEERDTAIIISIFVFIIGYLILNHFIPIWMSASPQVMTSFQLLSEESYYDLGIIQTVVSMIASAALSFSVGHSWYSMHKQTV